MPGIFGFFLKKSGQKEQSRTLIEAMADRLAHDREYSRECTFGEWYGLGNIGLPVPNERRFAAAPDNTFCAAFSGYIYGGKKDGDVAVKSDDDIGKLIGLYKNSGDSLPTEIYGSFNAAVIDATRRRAIICNDRFGHRQLYYYQDQDIFLFATEIKAFIAYPKFRRELDLDAACDYFNYGYPLGDKTFFKGVRILRGGHAILFDSGKIEFRKYWDYRYGEESRQPLSEMIEEIDSLYGDIIRARVGGARDIVIPLSGGLDSRFILAHTVQLGYQPYTFTHGRKNCHDHIIAKQVARELHVGSYGLVEIDPLWSIKYAEDFVFLTEGMVDASPAILMGISSQYGLPRKTTAFLNGIFGGPTNFGSSYFKLNDISDRIEYPEKIRRIQFALGGLSEGQTHEQFQSDFAVRLKKRYLPSIEEEFAACLEVSPLYCNQKDVFFIRNRIFRYMNLVDCNRFIWHDHFALADERLLDFFLKLPARLKPSRAFMVEYFKAKLPNLARIRYQGTGVDLYHRPSEVKRQWQRYSQRTKYYLERLSGGRLRFYNPKNYHHYNQWYRAERRIRDYYEGILLDTRTMQRGFFHAENLRDLLARQRRGANNAGILTSLLTFELFHRRFLD